MENRENYLALDMGAESGRAVVGTLAPTPEGDKLTLEEVHRFPTGPVRLGDTLHWDVPRFMTEIRTGMGRAASHSSHSSHSPIQSVGVDAWGVDFGLIGARGELVGLPVHYRDTRTNGMREKVFAKVSQSEFFGVTGLQTIPINTLFQLAALTQDSPKLIDAAKTLLFIPDLMHYFLTGEARSEYTIASTSQMLEAKSQVWATDLLNRAGIPTQILPNLCPAGSSYGNLRPFEALETGLGNIPVIAPGGHDTACAVAAVPADSGSNWAYLSSGTWSLLGIEIPSPLLTPEAEAANVTNEGGVQNTIRLLKNITGLWLVQECRRSYTRLGNERTYEQLTRLASDAVPLAAVIDPDHPSLMAPDDMPRAIRELCIATGQTPPEGVGATIRCCLDSLGLKYRQTLDQMEQLSGHKIEVLHIVGGGTQNYLLNQICADATGRTVITGPMEATASGNILLQALAIGRIESLTELRQIVKRSFPVTVYHPAPALREAWEGLDIAMKPG